MACRNVPSKASSWSMNAVDTHKTAFALSVIKNGEKAGGEAPLFMYIMTLSSPLDADSASTCPSSSKSAAVTLQAPDSDELMTCGTKEGG